MSTQLRPGLDNLAFFTEEPITQLMHNGGVASCTHGMVSFAFATCPMLDTISGLYFLSLFQASTQTAPFRLSPHSVPLAMDRIKQPSVPRL